VRPLALCTLLALACAQAAPRAPAPPAPWAQTQLFFGLSRPGGEPISPEEWQRFVDEEIARRFPGGFTVLDGVGQWRDRSGSISRERAKVVVLLHEAGREVDALIDEVRKLYCARFAQQSVLRADQPAAVSF
jgi:hypothetical protein